MDIFFIHLPLTDGEEDQEGDEIGAILKDDGRQADTRLKGCDRPHEAEQQDEAREGIRLP